MELDQIKEISIKMILSKYGIEPVRITRNNAIYFAINRTERTPSFIVDLRNNFFTDFGTGQTGTVIDIIMMLKGCRVRNAIEYLDRYNNLEFRIIKSSNFEGHKTSSIKITKTKSLKNRKLIQYLEERKISIEVAKSTCCELNYSVNNKNYYGIGFKNNAGGFEIRNKYFKGSSSPKTFTKIKNGKN